LLTCNLGTRIFTPVLGSARPEVWKGVLSWRRATSAHNLLPRGRLWPWVRRVLVAFVSLIVLLLLVGLLYQFVATQIAYRNYPAPGEMVSVSGHEMHLYCTGKAGGPTVVMDSGLGGGVLDWQTVQPKVAKFARVCSYDRSGIGWSESGPSASADRTVVDGYPP
jgi:hypothetical protein